MSKIKILLVEDDEDDYILALDYLDEINFLDSELVRATNATEAFDFMSSQHFDLCLLDYQLGGINGLEVLAKSQEMGFSAPIIMLTGHRDDILDQRALDAGAVDYLIKSEIDSIRFARAIRYALARRDVEIERVERLKAEAENQSKNRFLAHLSHELRTPLTAILGYTELLLNSQLGETSHSELDVILRNSRHLLNLLNDILDLSKIAADKLELNNSTINVDHLVTDVLSLLRVAAMDKGLEFYAESLTPIPVYIFSDETRLRQILINLLNNAIKFTDIGKVILRLRMANVDNQEMLCFDVEDSGMGIAPEKLASIFQPFSQVADVVSKNLEGSGLGLAISTELATRMGGGLKVTSELGVGSKFTGYINPGLRDDEPRVMLHFDADLSYKPRESDKQLQGRVLVVDDLRDIRRLVGHIVEGFGVEVEYAVNGLMAVESVARSIASGSVFDLVLMDLHMPEMDGAAAAKEMRKRNFSMPLVALTAASMRGSLEKLKAAGFDNLLSKPVDTEKLYEMLSQYLSLAATSVSSTPRLNPSMVSTDTTPLTILIVEDDDDAASALQSLLAVLGAEAKIASNVAEAQSHITQGMWNAILLDKNLPDGDGLALIPEVNDRADRTASIDGHIVKPYIVLISGESLDAVNLQAIGVDRVLLKPIQMSSLKTLIDDIRLSRIDH